MLVTPASAGQKMPRQGFGRPATRPEEVLLVCYYDPAGISTVIETVAYMQSASRYSVSVLNFFEHRLDGGFLRLHPRLDLSRFDAVIVHNTVAYNPDNVRSLDELLATKLRRYDGVKVLMKQDENFRFRALAQCMGEIQFDIVLTCLPPEAVPLVYPADVAGTPRFERMLTGYVTPTLRAQRTRAGPRRIDVGYRGSIQPLTFGRLAYEKRKIGSDVARMLAGRRDLVLDISSRWEDRLGGDAWFAFLGDCKATLGAESGASIFDLNGDLEERCAALEKRHAGLPDDERAEAVLLGLADLEGNVHYNQLSPRHFEAVACGAVQLLYPGSYSGLLTPGRHYVELARDCSNLGEAMDLVLDERRRVTMAECAYEEVILEPRNWIETFVGRLDDLIESDLERKGRRRPELLQSAPALNALVLRNARSDTVLAEPLPPGWTAFEVNCDSEAGTCSVRSGSAAAGTQLALRLKSEEGLPPWSEWQGAAIQAREALAEFEHLVALDDDVFCRYLGTPPSALAAGFRRRINEARLQSLALLHAILSCRGAHAVICTDVPGLVAGSAAKGLLGVKLIVAEAMPGATAAVSEAEAQFWLGLVNRLAVQADDWHDAVEAAHARALRVYSPKAQGYYLAAAQPSMASEAPTPSAGVPRWQSPSLVHAGLRQLWRRLPANWRRHVDAVRRRKG